MAKDKPWESVGEIACGPSTKSVEWKIRDYFKLPREVDHNFYSPTFKFCGCVWYLMLYPNGESITESEGWMPLYVAKKHPASLKPHMQFRLGIVRRDGSVVESRSGNYVFEKVDTGIGSPKLLKVSELKRQRDELVPDGALTIFCSLTENASEGVEAALQIERPEGVAKLVLHFKDFLPKADVTLKAGSIKYKVHSAVLVARSAVFSAMMKEKGSGEVQIDDCDPEAFKQFLAYLYTGNLEKFSPETVFALHGIADKYQTDELKDRCEQFLGENLSVEMFCDVLTLSLRHNVSGLLDIAIQFFVMNTKAILVTAQWLSFVTENPVEANELYIKSVDYNAQLK